MTKKILNYNFLNKEEKIGMEDINFPELALGLCATKRQKNEPKEIVFQSSFSSDERIIIKPSSDGYPMQSTRDLCRCLMVLTNRKNNFQDRRVKISLNEIAKELKIKPSGRALNKIKKNLMILKGTTIIFENCYFHKQTKKKIKRTIVLSVLSNYVFEESKYKKENDKAFENDPDIFRAGIVWDDFFFNTALENGKNLINFHFEYYLSLKNNISKELYLFLNKRSYNKNFVRIEINDLAFNKIGITRSLKDKLYKVRYELKKAHKELQETGFLQREPYFEKLNGCEYVNYEFPPQLPFDYNLDEKEKQKLQQVINILVEEFDFYEPTIKRAVNQYGQDRVVLGVKFLKVKKKKKVVIKNYQSLFFDFLRNKDKYDMWEVEEEDSKVEKRKQKSQKLQVEREAREEQERKEKEKIQKLNTWIKENPEEYEKINKECVQELEENKKYRAILDIVRGNAVKEKKSFFEYASNYAYVKTMTKIKIKSKYFNEKKDKLKEPQKKIKQKEISEEQKRQEQKERPYRNRTNTGMESIGNILKN